MTVYAGQEQQREQEQVVGTVTGVITKGPDKWQIQVAPDGSQGGYVKGLWTTDQGLVSTMMSQVGNRLAFLCNVSHWQHNGQPRKSLWVESAGAPSLTAPPQQVVPVSQGQIIQQPPMPVQQPQQHVVVQPQVVPMAAPLAAPQPDLREQKIHRQTAAKVAAILLGYLPEDQRNLATL